MACLDEEQILSLQEGRLDDDAEADLFAHVEACRECRELLSAMAKLEASAHGRASPAEAAPRDELHEGALIDHFRVLRELGHGAMGRVYLARDTRLGRKVALKILRPDRAASSDVAGERARLLAEARATARLSHPHVVVIHHVGEHEGAPYLALEYLEGETLRARLERERLAPREALRLALAVAEAVAAAHDQGVLHRDLKPENVMLPRDGRLRVVDFGLAKVARGAPVATMSESASSLLGRSSSADGGLVGTPAYMAPEQWREEPAREATDVWALGVLLYELLSAERPFREPTLLAHALAVSGPAPAPPLEARDEVGDEIRALVAACLDKDPARRPSAREVADGLASLLTPHPASPRGRAPASERSPFRGLSPFGEDDASELFGRDAEIDAFLERLRSRPMLPVVGPSGVGKSSFVLAGVIPRLRESGRWRVLRVRPGREPFAALARRLLVGDSVAAAASAGGDVDAVARLAEEEASLASELRASPRRLGLMLQKLSEREGARLLLVVDPLEELCALVLDPAERDAFLVALACAADDPSDPVRVVALGRDDFLGRLATTPEARAMLAELFVLSPLGADALREVLLRPVEQKGYAFDDPGLVDEMVAAVRGERAPLPLLQFAARELWERRDVERRRLLRASYDDIGGVAGALARHADTLLEGLPPGALDVARELLLRMVTPERTRRLQPRRALLDGLPKVADEVLTRLVTGRLVSVRKASGDDQDAEHELAHESLLHEWRRLAAWIDEEREARALLDEAAEAARRWREQGRRDDDTWPSERVLEARRRLERLGEAVPDDVRRFLTAGSARAARLARRRRRRRAAAVGALLVVALTSTVVAVAFARQEARATAARQRAEHERAVALREGARAALHAGSLIEARAKTRSALEAEDAAEARALWRRLAETPLLWRRELGTGLYDVAFSPDGERLAVAGQDKAVHLLDVATSSRRALRGHEDQVVSVAFSPDGARVAAGSWNGRIRVWSLDDGAVRLLEGHDKPVRSVAFSPDGRALASGGGDGTVRLWSLEGPRPPRVLVGHEGPVSRVAFAAAGARLLSASEDQTLRVWEASSGRELLRVTASSPLRALGVSPDGARAAFGTRRGDVQLVSLDDGEARPVARHASEVRSVWFLGGGELLSVGEDGAALVGPPGRAPVRVDLGHQAGIWAAAPSPDGHFVASASVDQSVRLGRLPAPAAVTPRRPGDGVVAVALAPDGQRVFSAGYDSRVYVRDAASGEVLEVLEGHRQTVYDLDVSADGAWLASASRDGTVRLWDAASGALLAVVEVGGRGLYAVRFHPSGALLAAAGADRTVALFRVDRQDHALAATRIRTLAGHEGTVFGLAFSPDGERLASAGQDRSVRVWDVESGRALHAFTGYEGAVLGVAFSPDGDRLVFGGYDQALRIADLQRREVRVIGREPAQRIYDVDFLPDGQRVVTASSSGAVRLWDVGSGTSERLFSHRGEANGLRVGRGGRLLVTGGDDGTARLYDVEGRRPRWRGPFAGPGGVATHRGWRAVDDDAYASAAGFRAAASERARAADEEEGSGLRCLAAWDGSLELWQGEERRLSVAAGDVTEVRALARGCLAIVDGDLRLYGKDGAFREWARGVTAVAVSGDEVLATTPGRLTVYDAEGAIREERRVDVGVTALGRLGEGFVLGFENGSVERLASPDGRGAVRAPAVSFERAPSSPVTHLGPGPEGTLVAGFANGFVGVWDTTSGALLEETWLHGAARRALVLDGRLVAMSELGDVWTDDRLFRTERCELLREIWDAVPVVWERGLPLERPPPTDHPCAGGSTPIRPPRRKNGR